MSRFSRPWLGQARAVSRSHTQSRTFTISRLPSRSPRESTRHDKEDFYQHYLSLPLRKTDLRNVLWPHVRTDSPEQNPDLALLDDQQSNADSVTHALECFTLSNQRHWNQPVTKTFDIYRQAKPGSLALRWLLHSEAICGLNRREHAKLLKLIVHCLVAEGNFDTVTEWILAKDAPT